MSGSVTTELEMRIAVALSVSAGSIGPSRRSVLLVV